MECNACTKQGGSDSFVYGRSARVDPNPNKSGILRPIKSLSFPMTRQKLSFYYTREEASPLCYRIKNKRQDLDHNTRYEKRWGWIRWHSRIIHLSKSWWILLGIIDKQRPHFVFCSSKTYRKFVINRAKIERIFISLSLWKKFYIWIIIVIVRLSRILRIQFQEKNIVILFLILLLKL